MNVAKLALCLTPLLFSGCVIGNSVKTQVIRNITLGQELTDLKSALDDGTITLSEYQALRAKIFESADKALGGNEWSGMMFDGESHDHDSDDRGGEGHGNDGHVAESPDGEHHEEGDH
jgi:hypothetical protein